VSVTASKMIILLGWLMRYRRPSLFAVLVFAVSTIRGRKNHEKRGKIVNFLAILDYLRLKTSVLVFADEDF
jgi:hypothetical protein